MTKAELRKHLDIWMANDVWIRSEAAAAICEAYEEILAKEVEALGYEGLAEAFHLMPREENSPRSEE